MLGRTTVLHRGEPVTIRTILLCWLCRKPFDLSVELFDGAGIGQPRYWCRTCTRPRFFSKRLREPLADYTHLSTDDSSLLREMIAVEIEFEGHRAAALAA